MKSLFFTLSLLFYSFLVQSQSFKTIPEFPISGEEIILEFDPGKSIFRNADIVEVLVYFNDHLSAPNVVILEKKNGFFVGTYDVPTAAKAIALYPFNRKLKTSKIYEAEPARCFFYEKDRKTPIKEVYFSMYKLLKRYNRNSFQRPTPPEDFRLLKKELATGISNSLHLSFIINWT